MEENNKEVSLYSIKKMAREENKKTLYTIFGPLDKRLWIIPDSELNISFEEDIPMFSANLFMDLDSPIDHIEVMDSSKVLCIKLKESLEFYNIEGDP